MEDKNKRMIITGGGTAGHIYPAISIIEYLKGKYPKTDILFIGTKKGMEGRLIADMDVGFVKINASGFIRTKNFVKKIFVSLKFLISLILGSVKSLYIIIRFKPDFILGMGGYVCGPVLLAAKLLNKKIVIHEQNFIPGRLNRFFAKFSEIVFTSFKGSEDFFKLNNRKLAAKIIYSGNPVRSGIRGFMSCKPAYNDFGLAVKRFTVISLGGSLGAEKINNSVFGLYNYFRDNSQIQILLICGQRFYPVLEKRLGGYSRSSDELIFRLFPYIEDMAGLYRIADLIISRAGATTVAELAVTLIPAILVPYPEAIDNHQFFNADYLARNKKAIIIPDIDLNEEILFTNIDGLLANEKEKYVNMKRRVLDDKKINSEAIIIEKLFDQKNH